MVGRRSVPFGSLPIFRGTFSFREGKNQPTKRIAESKVQAASDHFCQIKKNKSIHYCNFLGPSYTGLKKTTMEHKMNGSVGVSFGTMALAGIFMFPAVQGFGDNAIKVGNQKICVLWRENVGAEPCCKTRQGPHPKRYSSNPSDSDSDRGRPMGSVWNFFPRKKRSKKKRRIFSQKKNRPNTR